MQRIMSGIGKIIRKFFPNSMKKDFRGVTAPQMIHGHTTRDGKYLPRTRISNTTFIYHPENVDIEDNVFIWQHTIIDGTSGLKIKEGAQIGAWVGIFTHSSHIAIRLLGKNYMDVPEYDKLGYVLAPVEIGKYVFIAAGSMILQGVKIGDYSIVAAGSIVNKEVPPYSIVAGSPAKVIGNTIDLDLKEYEKLNPKDTWYNFMDMDYIENIKRLKQHNERRDTGK